MESTHAQKIGTNVNSKAILLGFCWSFVAVQNASASQIYTTGPVDLTNTTVYFSQDNYEQTVAVPFNLTSPNTIRSVDFWGVHFSSGVVPLDDTFRALVFGDKAGLPDSGNLIGVSSLNLVSRTDTGVDFAGYVGAHIQAYVMDFDTPISIPDTKTYWFGIQSTTSSTHTLFSWIEIAPGGSQAFNDYFAGWFAVEDNRSAFNLYDQSRSASNVPEPTTLTLAGVGAIGFALYGRSRRPKTLVKRESN